MSRVPGTFLHFSNVSPHRCEAPASPYPINFVDAYPVKILGDHRQDQEVALSRHPRATGYQRYIWSMP